jgi:hypothetical protein
MSNERVDERAFAKAVEAIVDFRSKNGTHWSLEALQVFIEAYLATPPEAKRDEWLPMETAHRDGRRLQLLCDGEIYHGWYEVNFSCFMGMDEDWNLWKLGPEGWKPLSAC